MLSLIASTATLIFGTWILKSLPNNRVHVLTEESQIGKLAKGLAETVLNPMVNGHQAWLDGLTKAAKNKAACTLKSKVQAALG